MSYFGISTSWLLLLILAILSIYWLWSKTTRPYTMYNIPPYPVKPWPFFGHFFLIIGNLRKLVKEMREKVGDIYSLDVVGNHLVVINNFKDIKEIWTKHADNIVNVPQSFGDELLDEYNTGIISGRDDNWKQQRTTSLSILKSFGFGKNLMAEKIQDEVSIYMKKLSSFKGKPENIQELTNISVSNIICSVIVGKRFDHDDPYFRHLVSLLDTIVKYFLHISIITPFKQVYYLPGDMFHIKKWSKASSEFKETFCRYFYRKIKQELKENEEPENFFAAYLKEMHNRKEKKHLTENNVVTLTRTLLEGGTETTSTTILWCVLYMLHHPEIQEKVYREIKNNIGTVRLPNISDRPSLPYLNAVIMETQRIASLVPVGLPREVSASFEACGYTFPKGSVIWHALDSVHFDRKIWGDPENFRPERFIDEKGTLINREELIPFGIGRRECLGESLAKMELFLFLANMFQSFIFEPADRSSALPSLEGIVATTVMPLPFKIRFVERKT